MVTFSHALLMSGCRALLAGTCLLLIGTALGQPTISMPGTTVSEVTSGTLTLRAKSIEPPDGDPTYHTLTRGTAPVEGGTLLSVDDCLYLVNQCLEHVNEGTPNALPNAATTEWLGTQIRTLIRFLEFRDELQTSLSHYRWLKMGEGRVNASPGKLDTDVALSDRESVRRVSALSLETSNGDVLLHRLVVWDEKDRIRQVFNYEDKPVLLQHGLPRRVILHLWRRTTVSRIEISYTTADLQNSNGDPRVTIWGGITQSQEYIKTAMWHLHETERAIKESDAVAMRRHLELSQRWISDYLRKRRPAA